MCSARERCRCREKQARIPTTSPKPGLWHHTAVSGILWTAYTTGKRVGIATAHTMSGPLTKHGRVSISCFGDTQSSHLVLSMTSECRNVHRLLDLKLRSHSPSRSPRLGTFYLRALDHVFDSTLYARSSFGGRLCTTSSRCILQNGSLPVGSVVSIVLICQPASRGNGILHSDPPSQTTTPAFSPYCIDGRQDC